MLPCTPTCYMQEDEEGDAVQRCRDCDVVEGRVQPDVLAKGGEHKAPLWLRQCRRHHWVTRGCVLMVLTVMLVSGCTHEDNT